MDVRTKSIITGVLTIVGVLGAIYVSYMLRSILILAFLSFIFSAALYPAVQWAKSKLKVPRPVSILSLYLLLFTSLSFLFSLILPPLVEQSNQLLIVVSSQLGVQELRFNSFGEVDFRELASSFDRYSSVMNQVTGSLQTVFALVSSTFTAVIVFFTFLVMSFHMLMSLEQIAASFAWLLPDKDKKTRVEHAERILQNLIRQMGAWLRGQLALMLTVGIATYIGLTLLGVPYAVPLAIFAGLLEIVPNLGPTIASIPGIIAATFLVNPVTGLAALAFYVLVQQVENNFLVPYIMREAVDVWPLTTILLMLSGFELAGVLGAIIALPMYLTIRFLMQDLYPHGPFQRAQEGQQSQKKSPSK